MIKCAKCGGNGMVYTQETEGTSAIKFIICSSCGGKGYVTDAPGVKDVEEVYLAKEATQVIKCPYCGRLLRIEIKGGEE